MHAVFDVYLFKFHVVQCFCLEGIERQLITFSEFKINRHVRTPDGGQFEIVVNHVHFSCVAGACATVFRYGIFQVQRIDGKRHHFAGTRTIVNVAVGSSVQRVGITQPGKRNAPYKNARTAANNKRTVSFYVPVKAKTRRKRGLAQPFIA